jgi:aminopeptidase YwaD
MTQVINFNRDFLYNIVCVLADVDAQNMLQAANIFPNPADDMVTIQLPGFSGELTIRVTDLAGKTVYSQVSTITDGQVSLNTENLSAGMYALEIRSGSYAATKKLMIGK